MTTTEEGIDPGAVLFDHLAADEPHGVYHQLLSACPVARVDSYGTPSVYISDYEDVCWAMRHSNVFSSEESISIGQEQPLIPLQVDPPLHASYRRLLNPPFMPKRIAELEPDVRLLVGQLIDAFADTGSCEFNEDFATLLPSTIFLRLMGLPLSDLPMFLQWRDNVVRPDVAPGDFEAATEIRAATGADIRGYLLKAIEVARHEPGNGLLGELVTAQFDGRLLTEDELLGISHLLLLGGLDTVTATLDCMITYLAEHPDRRQRLVDDPSIIPAAIEELLRHQSPVQVVPRIIKEPVVLHGVGLEAGDPVLLVLGAANVDTAEFEHPDEVDFDRLTNRHVAFSGGNHRCLGAHLARLELRIALEEFHRRIPHYRIAEGVTPHFSPGIRQADRVPLVWP